jgi:hypothetical protein
MHLGLTLAIVTGKQGGDGNVRYEYDLDEDQRKT